MLFCFVYLFIEEEYSRRFLKKIQVIIVNSFSCEKYYSKFKSSIDKKCENKMEILPRKFLFNVPLDVGGKVLSWIESILLGVWTTIMIVVFVTSYFRSDDGFGNTEYQQALRNVAIGSKK